MQFFIEVDHILQGRWCSYCTCFW